MKNIPLPCMTFLLLVFFSFGALAQRSLSVSGGGASGSGGSISYSVGQLVYTTHVSNEGTIVQGVQHAYTISEETVGESTGPFALQCRVYPNPASDQLLVDLGDPQLLDQQNLSYRLVRLDGQVIQRRKIQDTRTRISLAGLAPGSYLLILLAGQQPIQTFQIIKTSSL